MAVDATEDAVAGATMAAAHLATLTAEYAALREEIRVFLDQQKDMINLAVLLLVGVLGLIGKIVTLDPEPQSASDPRNELGLLLLLVPIPFSLLALASASRARRIMVIACYLHYDLRARIKREFGFEPWCWEDYKREDLTTSSTYGKIDAHVTHRAQWLLFLIPGLLCYLTYYHFLGVPHGGRLAIAVLVGLGALACSWRVVRPDEVRGVPPSR